ncbi:error-prone DNA polymerase [Thalassotalea sp. M1531]|uniref:Error-prone DNA polymerase n=1 Tax=Thalassotalea algicola TaxID=2716224 RepID=A0A7Y0LB93_9GAMM|nr:error-prone DNA polymerase [Thalassotalea algicola]NMP31344.1 error-prone DNA polymerase [Thalassotalea algicola]
MAAYAELICQSNFSFLHGASHPEELVEHAARLGYQALAITDECSVAGVVRAYSYIQTHGLSIKLIVGALFTIEVADSLTAKIVLLCPNRQAYAELCRVITNSRRRAAKGEYQLHEWDLKSVRHCFVLWLPSHQQASDQFWLEWLKRHYKSRLSIVISRELISGEHHYIEYCRRLAEQHKINTIASSLVLMHSKVRMPLQHTLTAIARGCEIERLGRTALSNGERSLRSIDKLSKLFLPAELLSTCLLANLCHFELSELQYEYPSELIPQGVKANDYLVTLVERGKKIRFPEGVPTDIEQIINKELRLITELGYEHFFITIYDIIQFAKEKGILYQGRGSAANSVVCYCLEITSVDPKQISVLFERFISQERQEPPDIDVDFEHERREEIFQYIYDKYGRERTAITATVITYRLKSAIREVGKALGIDEMRLDFFIKNINRRDSHQPWFIQLTELGLDIKSKKGQLFIKLVEEVKGFPRHLSQHVGGFVISKGPLYELVPVENAAMEGRTVVQWDKDDLAALSLLKVDILALGMLTAIRKCFHLITQHYQQDYSIAAITRKKDDKAVYDMIQQADTVGVFQIESRAQMSMLPRLKPKTYYDLVVQIAIVRPGPIQGGMVHPYLKRRNGEEAIIYPSKPLEAILSRTMGVPIFQEQVIKLAMVAAGFTGGEADQLRRAMGKWKKTGELDKFKDKLINGMLTRGYTLEFAEQIFQQICGFGEYGFPESHSASFAVLAYVSAWLKCHYPAVFYCSLLNSLPMGFYSASQLIQDAKRHGIEVKPVCINQSSWHHYLTGNADNELVLQLGFRIVNGLNQACAETIVQHRPEAGFNSFYQIQQLGLRKDQYQALASANCFHDIADNRYAARWQLLNHEHQLPLFAEADSSHEAGSAHRECVKEPSPQYDILPNDYDDLIEDYAATGLSLNKHPIQLLRDAGALVRVTTAKDLNNIRHKQTVTVAGVVIGRQSPGTASGVTFVTLEDDTGNVNVVVWVATARAQKQAFLASKILKVTGIVEREGQVIHVIAGRLLDITDELSELNSHSRDFH